MVHSVLSCTLGNLTISCKVHGNCNPKFAKVPRTARSSILILSHMQADEQRFALCQVLLSTLLTQWSITISETWCWIKPRTVLLSVPSQALPGSMLSTGMWDTSCSWTCSVEPRTCKGRWVHEHTCVPVQVTTSVCIHSHTRHTRVWVKQCKQPSQNFSHCTSGCNLNNRLQPLQSLLDGFLFPCLCIGQPTHDKSSSLLIHPPQPALPECYKQCWKQR